MILINWTGRAGGMAALALAVFAASVAAAQPAPSVKIAEARRVQIADQMEALGTLRARESVEITATVGERVTEVGFSDGDRVSKGQVLLRLSTEEVEALLTEARATAQEARQQYDRARQLASRGATSISQLDESRREWETANARVAAMESRLANLILTAPFDGVVGLRNISVGALVRPGDLVTTLDDDSVMLLDFAVPSLFLPALAPGLEIKARVSGPGDQEFVGKIRSVDSRVDSVTRSVLVRAEIPNPDRRLKPGLLMVVGLQANPREAVLIPESAVLPLGEETFAMVAHTGEPAGHARVERRVIPTGTRRAGEVEILSGIGPGELVVTHGGFRLADGANVRIFRESGSPPPASN